MPGARPKFTATVPEVLRLLRSERGFGHLIGTHLHTLQIAATPALWDARDLTAYQAALPNLLLRERRLITSEEAIGRNGLFFPNAIVRRVAFLFGAKCLSCASIGYGYQMLPLRTKIPDPKDLTRWRSWRVGFGSGPIPGEVTLPFLSFDMLRQPFLGAVGDVIEPLCPYCRFSFAQWVYKYAGAQPTADEIELSATAWLAQRVAYNATLSTRSQRPRSNDRKRDMADRPKVAMERQPAALPSVRL